jgi:N-acetylmuramoyl-L-alanine amidase
MKKRFVELSMAVIMLVIIFVGFHHGQYLSVLGKVDENKVVVIDAGHGGTDPGKVGKNDTIEKEINLQIALKLKRLLTSQDITVIMTREDDNGLYSENASNKKSSDMKERCKIINESKAALVVSIHQNSYTSEGIKGAQTFYYAKSEKSKRLAQSIQKNLVNTLDKSNGRLEKANSNYYVLLNSEIPAVIVECGFLSNYEESALLATDEYQDQVAWAIHKGILEYIKN